MRPQLAAVAAPLALTVAPVAYLLWGLLLGEAAPEPAPAKPVRVDAALLAPRLAEALARDPFAVPGAPAAPTPPAAAPAPKAEAVAAVPKAAGPNPAASPQPVRAPSPTATAAGPGPLASARSAIEAAARGWRAAVDWAEARARASRELQAEVSGRVRLSATSLRGRARAAILNDRVLAEGQSVPGLDSARGPVVVAQVRPASVVLRRRDALAVVSFPAPARPGGSKGGQDR